ncbi:hypothetical protein CTA2_7767 [Colletotrichum tanaceti]|nr:hypothetical protein CTA2_7767 [Colletotrichum tanaceti]
MNACGFVRAFPSLFSESDTGAQLQEQYYEAIKEWGYFLGKHSCHGESYAGRIDLCLWGTLGKDYLLYPMRRMSCWSQHLKSYKMQLAQDPARGARLRLCFHDNLQRLKGGKVQLFSVKSSCTANAENVEVNVEVWTIKPDLEPQLDARKRLITCLVPVEKLELYERPLTSRFVSRPRPVGISSDGQLLRVGSALYIRNEESLERVSLEGLEPNMEFFVEMDHRDVFLALARRGNITKEDLAQDLVMEPDDSGYSADEEASDDDNDKDNNDNNSDDKSINSLNSTPRGSACRSDVGKDNTDEISEEGTTNAPSTLNGLEEVDNTLLQEHESDFESTGNVSTLCSARESYSEGSTTEQSDVIGPDDEFWSNWLSDDGPKINDLSDNDDWASPPEASDDHDEWDSDIADHFLEQPVNGDPIRGGLLQLVQQMLNNDEEAENVADEVLAEYDSCPDGTTSDERVRNGLICVLVHNIAKAAEENSKEELGKDADGNVVFKGKVLTEAVMMNTWGDGIERMTKLVLESKQEDSDEDDERSRKGKNMANDEDSDDIPEELTGDWNYGDSSSESDSGLADLLGTGTKSRSSQTTKLGKDKSTYLCELVVLNIAKTTTNNSHNATKVDVEETEAHSDHPLKPTRAFHFAYKSKSLLFASPPAIHPSRPIVVWPIGGGELVFAHLLPTEKTFFTRNLGAGNEVCHLSIQVRFSPEGRHLHVACLDGTRFRVFDQNRKPAGVLIRDLLLRVSTYRLSQRKPARSPPRLIYQTWCPLQRLAIIDPANGSVSFQPVTVAPLPWTLTWDWGADNWGYVYACQSSKLLRVVRVPLFAKVEESDRASLVSSGGGTTKIESPARTIPSGAAFTNKGQVFLPQSADDRRIHFIPFRSSASEQPGRKSGPVKSSNTPGSKKPASKSEKIASRGETKADSGRKTKGSKSTTKATKGKPSDKSSSGMKAGDDDFSELPGAVVATLVLSSEDATNQKSDGISLPARSKPPSMSGYSDRAQVVYLRELQFGGWVPLSSVVWDGKVLRPGEGDAMSGETGKDGTRSMWMAHLKDKVERFDADDDCDIVDFIK